MSGIYSVNTDSSYMNSIFGSLNTNSSSSMSSLLGDYYSIRNGSYYQLAKKYYAAKSDSTDSTTDKKNELTTENTSKTSSTMKATKSATESLSALLDRDLYKTVENKDELGNTVSGYDMENIQDKLETFISDYNTTLKKAELSGNSSTVQKADSLIEQTKIFKSAFSKVGISVGDDDMLDLDEDVFAKANISDIKALFSGSASFGKTTQTKLLQLYSAESLAVNTNSSLYSSGGAATYSTGTIFDSIF